VQKNGWVLVLIGRGQKEVGGDSKTEGRVQKERYCRRGKQSRFSKKKEKVGNKDNGCKRK